MDKDNDDYDDERSTRLLIHFIVWVTVAIMIAAAVIGAQS
jgi:hypothetical protein